MFKIIKKINNKNHRGFTLIELLVVMAIIAALTAIVIPNFLAAKRKSRDVQRIADMKGLQTSIALYADIYGQFPTSTLALRAGTTGSLPTNTNYTVGVGSADMSKYNYTAYQDTNNKVIGYHIYTHLETKHSSLSSAAKCAGAGSGAGVCFTSPATQVDSTLTTAEPVDGTDAYFTDSYRTGDNDTSCASDTKRCVYDVIGGF